MNFTYPASLVALLQDQTPRRCGAVPCAVSGVSQVERAAEAAVAWEFRGQLHGFWMPCEVGS